MCFNSFRHKFSLMWFSARSRMYLSERLLVEPRATILSRLWIKEAKLFYLNNESETREDDFVEKQIDDLEQELSSSNNRNNPLRYTDYALITSIDIIHQQLQCLGNNTTRTHFLESVCLKYSAIAKNFEDKYAFLDFITCDMLYKTLGSDIDLENNITF